jgi:hypothetical protein
MGQLLLLLLLSLVQGKMDSIVDKSMYSELEDLDVDPKICNYFICLLWQLNEIP